MQQQLDSALLIRVANAAFLQPSPSKAYGFQLPYTVGWHVLGRLASTCWTLGKHLSGLRQLDVALEQLLLGAPRELPLRWDLPLERLLVSAVPLPPAWFDWCAERVFFAIPTAALSFQSVRIHLSASDSTPTAARSGASKTNTTPTRRQKREQQRERRRQQQQQQSISRRTRRR